MPRSYGQARSTAWGKLPEAPLHHPVVCSSRIASLTFSAISGERWCMWWAVFACSAAFFITSSSVAPLATKSHPCIRSPQCRAFMLTSLAPSSGLAETSSGGHEVQCGLVTTRTQRALSGASDIGGRYGAIRKGNLGDRRRADVVAPDRILKHNPRSLSSHWPYATVA